MQKHEYISERIKKVLIFKDCEILNINISYPQFNFKSSKKINKFYSDISKSFLKFCERKLYKNAVELFLLSEKNEEKFEIFSADIKSEVRIEQELIKIYLDIDINGEKTRRFNIWDLSGELNKPRKSNPKIKKKRFRSITT